MGFGTSKNYRKGTKTAPTIPTRMAAPTGKAGSKNSTGPKGGSSKSKVSVPNNSANRTSKRVNHAFLKRLVKG
jgi:hypothetical protein